MWSKATTSSDAAKEMNVAWDLHGLCRAVRDELKRESDRRSEHGAPVGLDGLDELRIHEIVAAGLASTGVGALREQRFPGDRTRRRRSEGERCDVVLTRRPGLAVVDPLAQPDLFTAPGVPPEEALWIEIKLVQQFAIIDGEARPHRGYSSQLLQGAMSDVRKLARDPAIRSGAVLLVMFGADAAVLEHDLDVWAGRALSKGLGISPAITESFPIPDRIGNASCLTALIEAHPQISES